MKFFKFKIDSFDFNGGYGKVYESKTITETHFLNVDDIKDIVFLSNHENYFSLIVRNGGIFQIDKKYLDNLFKLVEIKESEK